MIETLPLYFPRLANSPKSFYNLCTPILHGTESTRQQQRSGLTPPATAKALPPLSPRKPSYRGLLHPSAAAHTRASRLGFQIRVTRAGTAGFPSEATRAPSSSWQSCLGTGMLRFPVCEDMAGPVFGGCSNRPSKTRSLQWPFRSNSQRSVGRSVTLLVKSRCLYSVCSVTATTAHGIAMD